VHSVSFTGHPEEPTFSLRTLNIILRSFGYNPSAIVVGEVIPMEWRSMRSAPVLQARL
jgi:hypothetical protein